MNAKWKILNAFNAFDLKDKPIVVVLIYNMYNSNYCGDPDELHFPREDLAFWQSHIGETFELKGDPDISKFSTEKLQKISNLKEKVEFT